MTGSFQKRAGVAFLLGALAPLWAQQPINRTQTASPEDPMAVERGGLLFVANCGFCHGASAKGGESGPDLVRSVLVLDDEGGNLIGPVLRNGRPDEGMPKFNFTDAQLSDLVAWLHQRGNAAANRRQYTILDVVTGDAKAGQAYFASNCASCHSTPTSVGGDLAGIGNRDPVALQNRFLYPRQQPRPGEEPTGKQATVTVSPPTGPSVTGTLVRLDDFNVALRDSEGNYQSFQRNGDTPKVEIRDPLQRHAELLRQYTDADMHNILAYLVTLK